MSVSVCNFFLNRGIYWYTAVSYALFMCHLILPDCHSVHNKEIKNTSYSLKVYNVDVHSPHKIIIAPCLDKIQSFCEQHLEFLSSQIIGWQTVLQLSMVSKRSIDSLNCSWPQKSLVKGKRFIHNLWLKMFNLSCDATKMCFWYHGSA